MREHPEVRREQHELDERDHQRDRQPERRGPERLGLLRAHRRIEVHAEHARDEHRPDRATDHVGRKSSLHAKCVVVDGAKAFVSSANFRQRRQERNIEVGVLIEAMGFASYLAGQWIG